MVLRSEEKRWHEAKVTAKKKRNKLEGIVMSAKILIILTSDIYHIARIANAVQDSFEIIRKIGSHLENPDSFEIIWKIGSHLENPDSFEIIRKIGNHPENRQPF